ncbi:MAG: tetratricopeptide repeat protein [Bacteroidota bacterium]
MAVSPYLKAKLTNFFLLLLAVSLLSCGKERKNFVARFYHNTTSYFNGYYNADKLIKETSNRLDQEYRYPEKDFLDVIYYGTEEEIKNFEADFDKVIEKNDVVIYKHPKGNWVDDCRLMNGKGYFYKQNYTLAMQNFDNVLEKFPESKLIPEAQLWKSMTYYYMGNEEMALDYLQDNILAYDTIEFRKKALGELAVFQSELAIEREAYDTAMISLSENINHIKGRHKRAKANFLMGQLHTQQKNYPQALESYQAVPKLSTDYELTFNSKLKIARLYVDYQEGKDDDQKVYKYLSKMLRDEKNLEYQDQIYYEFALLELKKDSITPAIDYLKSSIKANAGNQRQKALSYYKIGLIYFESLQKYGPAQAYFDSAATAVTEQMPEYKEITRIAATLKDYVNYVTTIAYQDSMLQLATLSDEELEEVIDKVAEIEEQKRLAEQERQLQELSAQQGQFNDPFAQGGGSGGSWYFDNPVAIQNGKQQFMQNWGSRKNEDNWRRSQKQMALVSSEDDKEENAEPVDSSLVNKYGDRFKYYKDIPKTEEAKAKSLEKIEYALYNLGQIYSQKLNEPDSAVKTFETLLDRFENSEFTLQTRYALYQLYLAQEIPIYNIHKNYILSEHPKSVYAYLILGKDPNELKDREQAFKVAYTGLFRAYRDREYETALGFSRFLQAQFGDMPELDVARLLYIRGMSYGYLDDKDSLKTILTNVVSTYPEADVTPLARKTLEYLNNGLTGEEGAPSETGFPSVDESTGDPSLSDPNNPKYQGFTADIKSNDKIFVLMFLDKNTISKNDASRAVSNFNKDNFSESNLKVFTFLYQGTHLLPYISHFKAEEDAQKYVQAFKTSDAATVMLGEDGKIFYISHTNFKLAYGKKRMTDYIDYFQYIMKQ